MKIGLYLCNKGPGATRDLIRDCARAADTLAVDHIWVYDHIAIPRDQSEGSGGLYVDPLATLAFVAGATERVGIGTGVLDLPYRPPLPTAKWVASIQELSEGRLLLGVGVGWMEAEFQALGVDRARRGAITDETLEVLHRCFSDDEVELNGQRFGNAGDRHAEPAAVLGARVCATKKHVVLAPPVIIAGSHRRHPRRRSGLPGFADQHDAALFARVVVADEDHARLGGLVTLTTVRDRA